MSPSVCGLLTGFQAIAGRKERPVQTHAEFLLDAIVRCNSTHLTCHLLLQVFHPAGCCCASRTECVCHRSAIWCRSVWWHRLQLPLIARQLDRAAMHKYTGTAATWLSRNSSAFVFVLTRAHPSATSHLCAMLAAADRLYL